MPERLLRAHLLACVPLTPLLLGGPQEHLINLVVGQASDLGEGQVTLLDQVLIDLLDCRPNLSLPVAYAADGEGAGSFPRFVASRSASTTALLWLTNKSSA